VDDARQLWRRLVFNHLITNVDDHLQNIGFLYSGNNQWRLAPAFDLNPFPDKEPESKTWLSEDTGPVTSIRQLMEQASRFELSPSQARAVLAEVLAATKRWREVASVAEVGLRANEAEDFTMAFESKAAVQAQDCLR
jgi:serine/threonine-protein kinase HipA